MCIGCNPPYQPYERDYDYDFPDDYAPDWGDTRMYVGPPSPVDEAIDRMLDIVDRIKAIGVFYVPTSYIVRQIVFDAEHGQDIPF